MSVVRQHISWTFLLSMYLVQNSILYQCDLYQVSLHHFYYFDSSLIKTSLGRLKKPCCTLAIENILSSQMHFFAEPIIAIYCAIVGEVTKADSFSDLYEISFSAHINTCLLVLFLWVASQVQLEYPDTTGTTLCASELLKTLFKNLNPAKFQKTLFSILKEWENRRG